MTTLIALTKSIVPSMVTTWECDDLVIQHVFNESNKSYSLFYISHKTPHHNANK